MISGIFFGIEFDNCGEFSFEFDFTLKLVCRAIITRHDEVESMRCKYVTVAIVFMAKRNDRMVTDDHLFRLY
jgi:hypothetical protein